MKMKGFAMLGIGKTGWIEKDVPTAGPYDAIVKPLALSPVPQTFTLSLKGLWGKGPT